MAGYEIGSIVKERVGSGPASWGKHRWHDRWHAENINLYPEKQQDLIDIVRVFKNFIAKGHAPEKPILSHTENILTLGSCFAAELRFFLNRCGLPADSFWVPSGLNNTYALRDFFSWILTGEQSRQGYWYDRGEQGKVSEWTPAEEKSSYRQYMLDAGCIVLTIGLAEVWEDRFTSGVFWRGVPEDIFDSSRHRFRLTTVEENYSNLNEIIKLIREHCGDIPIVITLSPVPLKATFREMSCITADCVSKSVLRVAIDQAMQGKPEKVYYWPSFEMVKWYGCHTQWPVYGMDESIVRHVSRYALINIIKVFVELFFDTETFERFKKYLRDLGIPEQSIKHHAIVGVPWDRRR